MLHFSPLTETQKRFSPLRGRVVCLAGVPGSGKSTLCNDLAYFCNQDGLPAKHFKERVNSTLLNLFLDPARPENRKKYALILQLNIFERRLCTYWNALAYAEKGGIAFVDGPLICDPAFELLNYKEGNISADEHECYLTMLKECTDLPPPDYSVFLDCSPTTAMRRISRRRNKREIAAYDILFYVKLRHYLREAIGDQRTAVIPYDTDDIMDGGRIRKDYAYGILDLILSRTYEREGLPI